MGGIVIHYVIVLAVFLAIDAVWLKLAGPTIYKSEIGGLLLPQPNLAVALVFYALYAFGLLMIVIEPAISKPAVLPAVLTGALFGLVAYATYDMTNLATMKGFTWKIALIDMAWGTFLTASVTFVSLQILKRLTA